MHVNCVKVKITTIFYHELFMPKIQEKGRNLRDEKELKGK